MSNNWELNSADDVAQALDWLRRRMHGSALVLVAVGVNSIAYAKDTSLSPNDAAEIVQRQVPALQRGFAKLQDQKVTRGFTRRED